MLHVSQSDTNRNMSSLCEIAHISTDDNQTLGPSPAGPFLGGRRPRKGHGVPGRVNGVLRKVMVSQGGSMVSQ